ncbi:MAG: hypothetical protein Q8Q30_00405 [Candidatus Woesebacteria bacterium]|nr:hypothetical protein [Candidatus Woesebacteria bacterium]
MIHIVICNYCGKKIAKSTRRFNEGQKFGWKFYCSVKCVGLSKTNKINLICSREGCGNEFERVKSQFQKFQRHYCSHRCLALVVNSKRILKPKKKCHICKKDVLYGDSYCSPKCQHKSQEITEVELIKWVKKFYKLYARIPLKAECPYYSSIRRRYGAWNNFIKTIGFKPNHVVFAEKHIALDGHKCDSLAEKIIDDWLFRRGINHKINVPYPKNEKFTADFVIGNIWIEYFGLSGNLKRYDYLKRKKIKIAKRLELNLIELYPKDLFPKGNLNEKLKILDKL